MRALPESRRPIVVLACVLMRRNIDDLPALVDLAADLGVHWLAVSHMHPPTEELKRESLVHDVERARAKLDEAFKRAEALGLSMSAQPLDQLIAASATSGGGRRHFAIVDGAVEGLGARSVHMDAVPSWPTDLAGEEASRAEVDARRSEARAQAGFAAFEVASAPRTEVSERPESIWVCDFLWNKTYVTLTGDVRTCCVPGTPVIGNIERESFEKIWDDPVYAAMRTRIARRDPVPVCKGCQHITEVTDLAEIDRLLQGRALPRADSTEDDLPVVLDPKRLRGLEAKSESDAPILHWEAARDATGYEVELSLDQFKTIAFASAWHELPVEGNHFTIPDWVWEQAPVGVDICWRSVAILPELKIEVGLGVVVREAPLSGSPESSSRA